MKVYLLRRKGQISKDKESQGKTNKISLYLVYYYGPAEKREYEFLGLYLFEKAKTQLQKDHNKETIQLAESIRAKKVLAEQSSRYGFRSNALQKMSFLDFFKKQAEIRREGSDSNYERWMTVYRIMLKYTKGRDVTMEAANEEFLEGFKEFLQSDQAAIRQQGKKLGKNSIVAYFNIVKTALKEAFRAKILKENPSLRVKSLNGEETNRQYLNLEELKVLTKTPCDNPKLKKAFLFSALTGLRWSDVTSLVWGQIIFSETDGWAINYTQKKTKKAEILPVSENAIKFLGDRKEEDKLLFPNLVYSSHNNGLLQDWISRAGINKKITFHCARHSFATLQLSMDTDIYTVSKLLGHRHLRTTEIYAKVIDKKKIEAARRIPQIQL
ncbi:site-specific integrase [Polluticoccus soli]|uniref:site-specific integrase n=1 Tax=Polluticoccus soli TaxID=3034150 RepID=UPI0023E2ADA4|nr:site-specific integrase [Flavipsychrobacter sp. JY13-12]